MAEIVKEKVMGNLSDTCFDRDDTICAVATPAGSGGIAVIRVSGPHALEICAAIWRGRDLAAVASHTAHLGEIADTATGEMLDQAVATVFRAPHSFTGDDVVELSVHGSIYVQQRLMSLLVHHGARAARGGEFTQRAFAAGKLDLAQAEAVADIIAAASTASHRLAVRQMRGDFSKAIADLRDKLTELTALLELELDFSEEDVEFADRTHLLALVETLHDRVASLAATFERGDAIRRGVATALVGRPNAGKSSLLNRLLRYDRAIVSNMPGTTRDTVEECIDIDGVTFRIIDTAGLRDTADEIEKLGIGRTKDTIRNARVVLWLVDAGAAGDVVAQRRTIVADMAHDATLIPVINKTDIVDPDSLMQRLPDAVAISAATGDGIDRLQARLRATVDLPDDSEIIVTNARHYRAMTDAADALDRTARGLRDAIAPDFVAQDLREALHHLATITGAITTPDILQTIFSRFCIGK